MHEVPRNPDKMGAVTNEQRASGCQGGTPAEVGEMRIDELARRAGTTVRNVRAYQEKGLLAPPRRQGRVGLYSMAHLARLQVIGSLLERGFTAANIGEILAAREAGQDLAELLGLEAVVSAPWGTDEAEWISAEDLAAMFGSEVKRSVVEQAGALGLLERQGDGFIVHSPPLVHAGAELAGAGVPLEAALALAGEVRRAMEEIAAGFVGLVATHVFDPLGAVPPVSSVAHLTEVVQRLRPLVRQVAEAELARAMERQVQASLSERIGRLLEPKVGAGPPPG